MSTRILVGRIVRSDLAEVVFAAGGHHHELAWGSPVLGQLATMAMDPHDLLALAVRDGRVTRMELVQQSGPEGGAVLELEDTAPALGLRSGMCEQCHESGWVVEAPEELRQNGGPGRLLVLAFPGGDAA